MTLEQLLQCSADQLEAMSDEELTSYLSPFFDVTRPERSREQKQAETKSKTPVEQRLKMQQAELIAKQYGIDLKGIFK